MTRLQLSFECRGDMLAATLDAAPGTSGLLLISGGNEIRSGAFSGQARLAAELAAQGFPVFRFDRRGIGDSEGANAGFRGSRPDIEAALATFRALVPQMSRVVGFGNCDAASALMLAGGAGTEALVLSNPWTIEDEALEPTLPPSAIRARYAGKLKNPRELMRLARGGVNIRKLARGLIASARPPAPPTTLAAEMKAGLAQFAGPVRILLAGADRTAQVFAESWNAADPRIARCPRAGHAYVEPHAGGWLREQLLSALRA